MQHLSKIFYYILVIAWIGAPMLLNDVLRGRGILIPGDIKTIVIIVWYAIPLLYIFWRDKDKPNYKSSSRGPSYRKDADDWMHP